MWKKFTDNEDYKVRDHIINYHTSFNIPVIMYNLSGYDINFILTDLASNLSGNINVILLNLEKYITIIKYVENTRIRFTFIDSYGLMASSLHSLAMELENEKKNIIRRFFPEMKTLICSYKTGFFVTIMSTTITSSKNVDCLMPSIFITH